MIEELYIFVEGPTDSLFINKVFDETLLKICNRYILVEYANRENKKIKNYIETIKKVPNWDYIFISDQDGKIDKKDKILLKFKNLEEYKVFISIYEIESWIIAGISEKTIKKHKINFSCFDTSNITKEIFNNIIPKRMNKLEFISYVLSDYNLKSAINLNKSLNIFNQYLCNKKAS